MHFRSVIIVTIYRCHCPDIGFPFFAFGIVFHLFKNSYSSCLFVSHLHIDDWPLGHETRTFRVTTFLEKYDDCLYCFWRLNNGVDDPESGTKTLLTTKLSEVSKMPFSLLGTTSLALLIGQEIWMAIEIYSGRLSIIMGQFPPPPWFGI